jgi:ATP-dependent DNA helicase RecG
MVPTEILARQHYADACELLGGAGIKVELLLGSTPQKEKRRIYEEIENGAAKVVVGTHALITDKVKFGNLGLIVTDEQHRFGVAQRAVLKERAQRAHLLVMSATPIPRTLALAMYGDLDVSRITDMPKGRQRVDTYVVDEGYRTRLNDFIKKQVALGGQCYIVCPSIEGDGDEVVTDGLGNLVSANALGLKNATEYAEQLKKELPSLKIDLLHGRMKAAEKDAVMEHFSSGETKVLVSTTVIEVGVNVPNASLMIVENADRFGLSQLHQLRGRVGRGKRKSYCILVSDSSAERSRERLEVMRSTYDGFEIAERDLAMRGPGDFFSSNKGNNLRQSGGFDFKFAEICNDSELATSAFETAKSIISRDPELSLPEHSGLRAELEGMLCAGTATVS